MAKHAVMCRPELVNQDLLMRSPTAGGVTLPHPLLATPLFSTEVKDFAFTNEDNPFMMISLQNDLEDLWNH